jgi:hypothetical protein
VSDNGSDSNRFDTGLGWHVCRTRDGYIAHGTHPAGTKLGKRDIGGTSWAAPLDMLGAQLTLALIEAHAALRARDDLAPAIQLLRASLDHFHLGTEDGERWTLEWRAGGPETMAVTAESPLACIASVRAWLHAEHLGLAPARGLRQGCVRLQLQGETWVEPVSGTSWQGDVPLRQLLALGDGSEILIRVVPNK